MIGFVFRFAVKKEKRRCRDDIGKIAEKERRESKREQGSSMVMNLNPSACKRRGGGGDLPPNINSCVNRERGKKRDIEGSPFAALSLYQKKRGGKDEQSA